MKITVKELREVLKDCEDSAVVMLVVGGSNDTELSNVFKENAGGYVLLACRDNDTALETETLALGKLVPAPRHCTNQQGA